MRPALKSLLVAIFAAIVGLSAFIGFVGAADHQRFDWGLSATVLTGLGTLALAGGTAYLASSTWQDVRASQHLAVEAKAANDLAREESMRRPRLSLQTDEGTTRQTQVEADNNLYVRLLVRNEAGRRTAQGATVLVAHYTRSTGEIVTFGSPWLGWSGAGEEGGRTFVFPGASRVVDLGYIFDGDAGYVPPVNIPRWRFVLGLPALGSMFERAQFGPGTTIRLVVGADDAEAHSYDVLIEWQQDADSAQLLLASLAVSVTEVDPEPAR